MFGGRRETILVPLTFISVASGGGRVRAFRRSARRNNPTPAGPGGAPMKSKPADSTTILISTGGEIGLLGDAVRCFYAFDRRGADARGIRPWLDGASPVGASGSS